MTQTTIKALILSVWCTADLCFLICREITKYEMRHGPQFADFDEMKKLINRKIAYDTLVFIFTTPLFLFGLILFCKGVIDFYNNLPQ